MQPLKWISSYRKDRHQRLEIDGVLSWCDSGGMLHFINCFRISFFGLGSGFWIGLDWIGLDWIGLDWIGLDWIGLDWV